MSDRAIISEVCPNCHERKIVGLPCTFCGLGGPGDAELCPKCGEYKIRGQRCTSPNHPKEESDGRD